MGALTTAERALVRPGRVRANRRVSRRSLAGYAFVAPALILLIVFALGPFLFTIWVSLHSWNMLTPLTTMPFAGTGNYSYLLNDDALFRETFGNTVYFAVGNVVISVVLALSIALILNGPIRLRAQVGGGGSAAGPRDRALAACSAGLEAPPSDAPKADFCAAYAGSAGIVDHTPGDPVQHWDTVRAAMLRIHEIGTPAGSDHDARTTVLRLSDIVANATSESDARVQVDGLIKDDPGALAKVRAFYARFCAR